MGLLEGHLRRDREGRDYDRGHDQAAIDQQKLGHDGGGAHHDNRDLCETARGIAERPDGHR